ncbi:hypothetical protein GCM10027037_24930 [Mucilaginibacter koreensis]
MNYRIAEAKLNVLRAMKLLHLISLFFIVIVFSCSAQTIGRTSSNYCIYVERGDPVFVKVQRTLEVISYRYNCSCYTETFLDFIHDNKMNSYIVDTLSHQPITMRQFAKIANDNRTNDWPKLNQKIYIIQQTSDKRYLYQQVTFYLIPGTE